MRLNKNHIILKTFFLVIFLVFSSLSVFGATFDFNPVPPSIINISEGDNFTYDVNVTCPESNVIFSLWSSDIVEPFSINISTGLISVSPDTKDVGSKIRQVIIKNRSNPDIDIISHFIIFNILNINDPPIIVNTTPVQNYEVDEDSSLDLTVTAYDKDFEGNNSEFLNFTWFLDGVQSPKLSSIKVADNKSLATYSPNVSHFDAGLHNITVIVSDSSNLTDSYTWTIDVENVNQKPIFNGTIANISLNESSNKTNFLRLGDYFSDPDTNGTFTEIDTGNPLNFSYDLINGSDVNVTIFINQTTSNVSIFTDEYWFGNFTIRFYVDDNNPADNIEYSNNVSINVININDPPILGFIDNQTAYGYAPFSYNVTATDLDMDELFYYIDSSTLSNITINLTSGLISLLNNNSAVGNHSVNVTVGDGEFNVSQEFNLEFKFNLPPVIYNYTDIIAPQHNLTWFIIKSSDPEGDIPYLNTTHFLIDSVTKINNTDWNFSLTPHPQNYVGNSYEVFVFANDSHNAQSQISFSINITETYMPPVIFPTSVPNDEIKLNKLFLWKIEAEDEEWDIADFTDDTDLFNLSVEWLGGLDILSGSVYNATAVINFTPTQLGSHNIDISVIDAMGFSDSFIFNLNIVNNTPPHFTNLNDFQCSQGVLCTYDVEASDHDWQDVNNLTFSDNTSLFEINSTNGIISFTSSAVGLYNVTISVSDGMAITSENITINISEVNHPPYFLENISALDVWPNVTEGLLTSFNITAVDDKNETITSYLEFVNFTTLNGTVITSGMDLFNLDTYIVHPDNSTTYFINFTPSPEEVGTYYVKFIASDNNSNSTQEFSFSIININNLPDVTWTLNYTNQSLYTTRSNTYYSFTAIENTSLSINTSAFDSDYDSLNYTWIVKYANEPNLTLSNQTYLNYTFPFNSAPKTYLHLIVNDSHNTSRTITWDINVINVNRPVIFGEYIFNLDENSGTFINTTIIDNTLKPVNISPVSYSLNSSYISPELNFLTTSSDIRRIDYQTLSFNDKVNDSSYDILFNTFTSDIPNVENRNFLPLNNTNIMSNDYRYLNFRVDFNLTNPSIAPEIDNIKIDYKISNLNVTVGTEYIGWIDLNHFFTDPDGEVLTYNLSVLGDPILNASIIQEKFVNLRFFEEGTTSIQFNATDPYNSSVLSNIINITINTAQDQSETETNGGTGGSSGSGGIVTVDRPRIVPKKEDNPISIDLIHPENVTIYDNETIRIPIKIQNNEFFDLRGVNISASSSRIDDIDISLDTDYFDIIEKEDTKHIIITIIPKKIFEDVELFVKLNVDNPAFEDSTKILLTNFKRLKGDNESEQLKFAFVNDLLAKNSECSELTEYINRAREYYDQGSITEGNALLEQFISDCKYLISNKAKIESPSPETNMKIITDKLFSKNDHVLLLITISVIIIGSIVLSVFIYKKV